MITQPAAKKPRRDRNPRGHQAGRQNPGGLPAAQVLWVLDCTRRLSRLPRVTAADCSGRFHQGRRSCYPPEEQHRLARAFLPTNVRLVAEKVKSHRDFHRTLEWGYDYFQGYFFSRPQVRARRDVSAYKLNHLRVLRAANRPQMDIREVSEPIKKEMSLSYRLLRYLNSPAFFLVAELHSIPQALSLLGERGVRKWVLWWPWHVWETKSLRDW